MPVTKKHSLSFVSSQLKNNDVDTGADVELLTPGDGVKNIRSILIANTHTNAATVDLFIRDNPTAAAAKTFYLIKTVSIPVGASLLLDKSSIPSFDNSSSKAFGLYLTIGATDGSQLVDIIIS